MTEKMEREVLEWCKRQWSRRKVVTRGVIFDKALEVHPGHCGGKTDPDVFAKLKNWFYTGFNKRCKLSKRRISSTGQKLAKNWREKRARIVN